MSELADRVRAAADHIEKVGLHKGSMYDLDRFYDTDDDREILKTVPCCTVGALHLFGLNGPDTDIRDRLGHQVGAYEDGSGDTIPDWNDAEERTPAEVVTALRELADALDAETE